MSGLDPCRWSQNVAQYSISGRFLFQRVPSHVPFLRELPCKLPPGQCAMLRLPILLAAVIVARAPRAACYRRGGDCGCSGHAQALSGSPARPANCCPGAPYLRKTPCALSSAAPLLVGPALEQLPLAADILYSFFFFLF